MSTRNLVWLLTVLAVGLAAWLIAGWIVGLIAAAGVLVISELVERRARRRRLAAQRAK